MRAEQVDLLPSWSKGSRECLAHQSIPWKLLQHRKKPLLASLLLAIRFVGKSIIFRQEILQALQPKARITDLNLQHQLRRS